MKKTLTANISGTVFHIEEDAYEKLQRYLATIRDQFTGSDGRDEIMGDIESRIAELFTERLDGKRQVVSIADVEHVVGVMGQPEDYMGGAEGTDQEPSAAAEGAAYAASGQGRYKRLFRHPDDKWIGGVFGGLGAYLHTDPLWMRILFIALVFFGVGSPILIYLIVWVLVPVAESAAERLMMEGEPVTVDNLKRTFQEGSDRVKYGAEQVAKGANELGRKWSGPQAQQQRRNVMTGFEQAMRGFGQVFSKVFGVFLLMLGTVITISLLALLATGGTITNSSLSGMEGTGIFELAAVVFESGRQGFFLTLCVILLGLMPGLGLFLGGWRLVSGTRVPAWLGWSISTIWTISLIVVIIIGSRLASDFNQRETLKDEAPLMQPAGQTLYLGAEDMRGMGRNWNVGIKHGRMDWDMDGLRTSADSVHLAWAELDVVDSPDSLFHLIVQRQANGNSEKLATARASHIGFRFVQSDSLVRFSPWVDMPKKDKLRAQQVRFIVQVPMGRAVHFESGSGFLLDDVDNVTNTYDSDMVGLTWTMTSGGLSKDVRPEDMPDDLPKPISNEPAEKENKDNTPSRTSDKPTATKAQHASLVPNLLGVLFGQLR